MSGAERQGALLDLVYQAALEPALWVTALERFADLLGAEAANLTRLNVENGTGSGLESVLKVMRLWRACG